MENTSNTRVKCSQKRLNIQAPKIPSKQLEKDLNRDLSLFNIILKRSKIHKSNWFTETKKRSTLSQNEDFLDTFKRTISKKTTISTFPYSLLNSSLFVNFESCQLLVHEKGKMSVDNYFFTKDKQQIFKKIEITKFNYFFNLVKKSKRKLFSIDQIENIDLDILGTFLAKDFDFKNHSILVILSRNSFLPSTTNEIAYFEQVANLLKPTLNKLLIDHTNNRHNHVCKTLFENFPISLQITPLKQKSNSAFYEDVIENHKVDDKNIIKMIAPEKNSSNYDSYHIHRINLLGELLNTLKHEISNPLFGITLGSQLLEYEKINTDSLETLADINSSCQRCQNIMNSFSYLYNHNDDIRAINIIQLIEETITLTKSETRQIEKVIEHDPSMDIFLETNPTYLSQILFNLIINASQSINNNQPINKNTIHIKIVKSKTSILVHVKDSGSGIEKEIISKVFDPFFTTKSDGTGLGLSICSNLAELINGKLSCKNNDSDQGSTFTLEIGL